MEREELTNLLQFLQSTNSDNNGLAATILKLTADSITLETLKSLNAPIAIGSATGKKTNK